MKKCKLIKQDLHIEFICRVRSAHQALFVELDQAICVITVKNIAILNNLTNDRRAIPLPRSWLFMKLKRAQ